MLSLFDIEKIEPMSNIVISGPHSFGRNRVLQNLFPYLVKKNVGIPRVLYVAEAKNSNVDLRAFASQLGIDPRNILNYASGSKLDEITSYLEAHKQFINDKLEKQKNEVRDEDEDEFKSVQASDGLLIIMNGFEATESNFKLLNEINAYKNFGVRFVFVAYRSPHVKDVTSVVNYLRNVSDYYFVDTLAGNQKTTGEPRFDFHVYSPQHGATAFAYFSAWVFPFQFDCGLIDPFPPIQVSDPNLLLICEEMHRKYANHMAFLVSVSKK